MSYFGAPAHWYDGPGPHGQPPPPKPLLSSGAAGGGCAAAAVSSRASSTQRAAGAFGPGRTWADDPPPWADLGARSPNAPPPVAAAGARPNAPPPALALGRSLRPSAASSTAQAILSPTRPRRVLHTPAVAPEPGKLFPRPLPPGIGSGRLLSTYQGLVGVRSMGTMLASGEVGGLLIPQIDPVVRMSNGCVMETAVSCEAPEWFVGPRLNLGGEKMPAPTSASGHLPTAKQEGTFADAIGEASATSALRGVGRASVLRAQDTDGNGDFDEVAALVHPDARVKGNKFDHWRRADPVSFSEPAYAQNVARGRRCVHGAFLCDYHPCKPTTGRDEVTNLEVGLVAPMPRAVKGPRADLTHRVEEAMMNTYVIPRQYYGRMNAKDSSI